MKEITLMQVLDARERRAAKQKELLQRFGKTLICFTLNIPGPVKVWRELYAVFKAGDEQLRNAYCFLYVEDTSSEAGLERFYVVDADPLQVKQYCTAVEMLNKYGRLFDLDVLTPDGKKLDRADVGMPRRKCLLCDQDAAICGSRRAHTVQQLQQAVRSITADSVESFLVERAVLALLEEVSTTPKPGLVDRNNSGSHKDMNISHFQKSAFALYPYFRKCAAAIADTPQALFNKLRPLGMEAEQAMLAVTGGVNTHKGAIFSIGIVIAAAARCFPDTRPETVLNYCAQMTAGVVARDFGNITQPKTVGEKLYVAHGISGIRGQAEQGFPAVLNVGLPVLAEGLDRGLSFNDAGCAALLHLLSVTDDTNLIHRSDLETLRQIQQRLKRMLTENPYPSTETIEALDQEFIEKNLSPGGSADLLALTYFLHRLN